ncbi:hypothetical protein AH02_69 [Pseudomonas phage AH02]|nr:hypothetical protein AH02_69 [Pseudomonas phage AH02]
MVNKLTRGVRNNNPGNIDYNKRNDWQGQLGYEEGVKNPRFARFDSAENGIRALAKLLLNYRGKDGEPLVGAHGIDTVQEVINRLAPPVENDTVAYAKAVAKGLGVSLKTPIKIGDVNVLLILVREIIKHENAGFQYPQAVLSEGVRRALA